MTTPVAAPIQPVTPTPKNGAAAPQTPVVPTAQSAPPPDASAAEIKQWREKAERAEAELGKKTREAIATRRKADDERKTFGERLKSADEYDRLRRDGKVSPLNAVSKLLGVPPEKALELLNTVAANGNAPTAESIAQALADQEAATEQKFKTREEQAENARREAEQKATESHASTLRVEAASFVKALVDDYPVFKTLGDAAQVGAMLAQRIQSSPAFARYRGALQYADSDTRVTIMKAAADALESQVLSLGVGLLEHEKYKGKFAEKLTPPRNAGTVPPVARSVAASSVASQGQSQVRRTLGNDLTGSTPGEAPKLRTEEERIKAARAAGQALLNRG